MALSPPPFPTQLVEYARAQRRDLLASDSSAARPGFRLVIARSFSSLSVILLRSLRMADSGTTAKRPSYASKACTNCRRRCVAYVAVAPMWGCPVPLTRLAHRSKARCSGTQPCASCTRFKEEVRFRRVRLREESSLTFTSPVHLRSRAGRPQDHLCRLRLGARSAHCSARSRKRAWAVDSRAHADFVLAGRTRGTESSPTHPHSHL